MNNLRSIALVASIVAGAESLPAQTASVGSSRYTLPPAVLGPATDTTVSAASDHWEWTIAPYLLAPTMSGKTGVGNLPSFSVDASASEIFSHLQIGAMLAVQARKGPWAFALDGIYMDLKQDLTPDATRVSGSVTMKQGALEGFAFREASKEFEIALGGMVNSIQASASFTLTGVGQTVQNTKSKTETWAAPVAGIRWTPVNDAKWHAWLFADIGGLSGDNWTWQALPSVGYRFGHVFELDLQYRWIGITYHTGSGSDTFLYEMTIFGPQIAFAFHF